MAATTCGAPLPAASSNKMAHDGELRARADATTSASTSSGVISPMISTRRCPGSSKRSTPTIWETNMVSQLQAPTLHEATNASSTSRGVASGSTLSGTRCSACGSPLRMIAAQAKPVGWAKALAARNERKTILKTGPMIKTGHSKPINPRGMIASLPSWCQNSLRRDHLLRRDAIQSRR